MNTTDRVENPKESAGRQKCPLHLLPAAALRETALVHKHGLEKYGEANWLHAGVNASTYIAAMMRHTLAWAEGEDLDPESGLSHLAHIAACCNILLDTQSCGMMNDDRTRRPDAEEAVRRMANSVLVEVTPDKPIPVCLNAR